MSDSGFARTPAPPYWAVLFTSRRTPADGEGYAAMSQRMVELASQQPGFLGVESVRGEDGMGITISYWQSLENVKAWKEHLEHREAQRKGRTDWYGHYELRVALVERTRSMGGPMLEAHEPGPASRESASSALPNLAAKSRTVVWRLHVPAPPEVVYHVIASDEGRSHFWAESAEELDGVIHFVFSDGAHRLARVVERHPPVAFALEYFAGVARFELAPDGSGGTDLTLTHRDVPEATHQEIHASWLNILLPLKAWAAFNVDIRNHDRTRTWSKRYADS
jgi:heme-degrading monooxygenase HmoA